MSWMPPELAVSPEDKEHKCSECNFVQFAEEFTNENSIDLVCNDCYESNKFLCGVCGELCEEYTYNEETDVDECNKCKKKEKETNEDY